jgi:hypothetical protein
LGVLGDLGALEKAVTTHVRTLGNALLQRMLDRPSRGYAGSSIPCSCGGRKKFVAYRPRQVHGSMGWLTIRRAYYHCPRCKTGDAPYDRQVGLGDEQITPALAKACCVLGVRDSFEESSLAVEELLGQEVSAKTIERVVHHVGGQVLARQDQQLDSYRQDHQPPEPQAHPKRLYVAVDGTTVHEKDGWHEVKAARLYWENDRCRRQNYTIGRFDDSQTFGWHAYLAACRCGLRQADEVVFLGDGAAWIRTERERHFSRATFIVDWFHANEHIWDCGKALHGEGTAAAAAWSTRRESWLWDGQTRRLTRDLLRQMKRARGAKREALNTLHRYIATNEWEMRYDVFRAKGYDIGSGAVEGACRHVVGDRLKLSGMIWTREGSSTTLALRTTWLNGQWNDFWTTQPLAA